MANLFAMGELMGFLINNVMYHESEAAPNNIPGSTELGPILFAHAVRAWANVEHRARSTVLKSDERN